MKEVARTTSRTLLERLRDPADRVAWERFFVLYAPLVERYARAQGLGVSEAADVRDECLARVAAKLPEFRYDPARGTFKAWLYRIARGAVIDRLRRPGERRAETAEIAGLVDPEPSPDVCWERTWRNEHLRHALEEVRARESERTFRAFELLLVEELPVTELCERLGMNANQVYKAKARVLRRVKEVLGRLGGEVWVEREGG